MKKKSYFSKRLWPFFRNKYVITTLLFLSWLAFFDKNDFYSQYQYRLKLKAVQQDKAYFVNEVKKNRTDLQELTGNPESLEKFAREKYLMKKDNEDVFVLVSAKAGQASVAELKK